MRETVPTESLSYRISVSSYSADLPEDDEPSSFATHLPLEVRQGDLLVARVHALLFRLRSAERYGVSAMEVFDSIDQDVHELYCAIFDPTRETLRGDLVELSDFRDILYVESVKVVPSRRGQKLGLQAVDHLREVFGGSSAALTLKAFPLTADRSKYEEAIDYEVFSKPFATTGEAAKAKLRAYWSQLGFERVDHTDYMLFDMNEEPPAF